ncbi:unnamed protein product, partial [marine sediment metagenome]
LPRTKRMLNKLHPILIKVPNEIVVGGHTDNVPISTKQYPSNWELSTARATNVVRYLIKAKEFPPERISAVGYGEYRPITDNSTAEGRQKNRRVVFLIKKLGKTQKPIEEWEEKEKSEEK